MPFATLTLTFTLDINGITNVERTATFKDTDAIDTYKQLVCHVDQAPAPRRSHRAKPVGANVNDQAVGIGYGETVGVGHGETVGVGHGETVGVSHLRGATTGRGSIASSSNAETVSTVGSTGNAD